MSLFYLSLELQYERLNQILVKLKYKLQDVQRIKINVDIKLDLLLLLHHRMMYLNYDPLKV
jgi:hypothetical protein